VEAERGNSLMKNMRAKGTGRSAATAGTKVPPQFVKAPAGLKPSSPQGFQVLRSGFNRAEEETPDNLCMGITKTIKSTPATLHVTVTLPRSASLRGRFAKVTVTSLLILLAALLFAACGQSATQVVGTETPSETQTRFATPVITHGAISTAIPTKTLDLWEIKATETQTAGETKIAPFSLANCGGWQEFYLISPDNNWLAAFCYYDSKFIVTNQAGTKY